MKILQIGKFYYPESGGIEQVVYEITDGLNQIGYRCDVLCSNTKNRYEKNIFKNYIVYRTASFGIISSTSISPQLIYKLWKIHKDYDVIHIHHPNPLAFLAIFLVRSKAKIIVHWHSDIIRQKKLMKYFLPLQNWVLSYANKIITTSNNYAKYSHHLLKYQDKIENIPIGISNKNFISNVNNVKKIQKKYKNKKIILGIGRLVSYKGFKYLVESAKYLSDDFIILIGGTGIEKEKLLNFISLHKLEDKVALLGYISEQEKYDYIKASFLFCLPSITQAEAFGVVILEAMAFAKPIVSTNIKESGMSWINENNVTGIQVDKESSKQLAEAFKEIASNEIRYKNFCENSLKRYKKIFTREEMIISLTKLYDSF